MTDIQIGNKIRNLRIKNGLTQEELANRSELSKGFISQLECDNTSPSIATLIDILECLGTNIHDFFSEKGEEKIVFSQNDYFTKENQEDGNSVTWIIPNCQKNDMEPVLLELAPGGMSDNEDAHSGEEFGYVLSGTVIIHIGDSVYKAKKGESFYYNPDKSHFIENKGSSPAKILWVSTPPSF